MDNWIIDYHHAFLIRLIGLVLMLCALFVVRLLARQVSLVGSSLMRRLPHGDPICRHQKS